MWSGAIRSLGVLALLYTRHATRQLLLMVVGLGAGAGLFFYSMLLWEQVDFSDEEDVEVLVAIEAEGGSLGDEKEWLTLGLWTMAVVVEQCSLTYASVFGKMPFVSEYAGERMQAWLMLAFGESVISLLEEPSDYRAKTVESFVMSFGMMLMMTITYFDVVNADSFLEVLCEHRMRCRAWCFMLLQAPLSFVVFFIGKLISCIIWVHDQQREIHHMYGCEPPTASLFGGEAAPTSTSTASDRRFLEEGDEATLTYTALDQRTRKFFFLMAAGIFTLVCQRY